MLALNIINYIVGSVRIRVSATIPEKLINICMASNIHLWGIMKIGTDLYAWMRLSDFFRIRPIARKSHTRIRVVRYSGMPFLVTKIKRRKMLIVGALLFILSLHILSSFIWFIDVSGLKVLPENRIMEVLHQNGLRPGVGKDKIDIRALETAVILNIPEVAWVGINFTGTRATVEIVEKTLPKLEDKTPSNIIANKDGVIIEILTILGQNAVKKGDTVKKGDLLIKGTVPEILPGSSTEQPTVIDIPAKLIKASGIVKARVWYESYGEASLQQEVFERTGRQYVSVMLKVGQQEFVLKKPQQALFSLFETEVIHKKLPGWRNTDFSVESNISVHYELKSYWCEKSPEEARDIAKIKAMQEIQRQISENAYVLSRNVELLKTPEANLVRVKISVETIEDIGQSIPIIQ